MADAPEETNLNSTSTDDQDSGSSSLLSQRGPLIIALVAAAAGLILIFLFVFLIIRSDDDGSSDATPTPEIVDSGGLNTDRFPYQAISDSGAISVTMETPIFLDVSGEQFTVQAEVLPESGPWNPPLINETTVAWPYGAVINYIFGLDDTNQNQELLQNLEVGQEIVLTTRSGNSAKFVVSSRNEIASDNLDIFAQRSPGVTLLLIEEDPNESRLVVHGRYVQSDIQQDSQAGRVVELGDTAQLESLQFTVSGAGAQYDRPEAPPGFAFYLVDYQVQNVGTVPFDTQSLSMVLADDVGNLYALNPSSSQLGNNPPLLGPVSPGQTIMATAGYQIPAGLVSAILRWQVALAGTNSTIQVNIPFQDISAADSQAIVEVQEVSITPDGNGVLIVGQISNTGLQPIVIGVENVSLVSSIGTVHQILSTNPAFSWTVPAGQTLLYGVTFQRPNSPDAVFTLLNQSFLINGLR